MGKTKALVHQRTDDMEVLRLRQENESLNQLFRERADQLAELIQDRASLRAEHAQVIKVLEELVRHLRATITR
jgi:hypothetical protein